jgi:large subunit ribosomal protein L30
MASQKQFKVTLVKSTNGTRQEHRACVRGMGLSRIGQTVTLEDTPATRGMATKVAYLVRVEG